MKCIVIYFTQTGNTEKVARAIQAGAKQAAGNCDIVKIKDANPRRLYQYDLIGLGSPIFHAEEPGNVSAFIKDMRFVGGKQVFAFSTHGTHPEYFFPNMVRRLKRRGLIVIGMRDWYGDCPFNYNIQPYPTAGHPDKIDLKEAEDFGREMVEHSRWISAGETRLIPPPPPEPELTKEQAEEMLKEQNVGSEQLARGFKDMRKFHKEKCKYPKCRICMDNCPVDGIDLSVEPPVLGEPCLSCEFCARICPTGALDMDAWIEAQSKMAKKKMFLPMLLADLEKAEAEGRFRRLVPTEKVGTNPLPPRHKHPQWIIGKGLQ